MPSNDGIMKQIFKGYYKFFIIVLLLFFIVKGMPMKKFKSFLCLILILFCLVTNNITSSASGVIVTPSTFGSNNSIKRIEIGYDVTEIQDGSFSNLKNLSYIDVDSNNQYYASYDGCLYNKDYTVLLCLPQNTTSVIILNSVKSYSQHALDGVSQERKNRLDSLIANGFKESPAVTNNNSSVSVGNSSDTTKQNNSSTNTQVNNSQVNNTTQSNNGFWFNGDEYYENGRSHYDCGRGRDSTFEEVIATASEINPDPDFVKDCLWMAGWSKVGE